MYKKIAFIFIFLTLSIAFCWSQEIGNITRPVKLFILGGQSNMDGTGDSKDLPEAYAVHPENTMTWDNRKKCWMELGTDSFAIRRKFKFGPEIVFSHVLAEKYPDYIIAVVKTSGGGTKLWKHWLPDQPMYKSFLRNMENAVKNLNDNNVPFEIEGMLWMQGESDAETIEWANAYENNLKILFADVRKQTNKKYLPIVMGRISIGLLRETPWDFDYTTIVQKAQDRVASDDNNVSIINTDNLQTLKDNTHFNSNAQISLGREMGERMLELIQ